MSPLNQERVAAASGVTRRACCHGNIHSCLHNELAHSNCTDLLLVKQICTCFVITEWWKSENDSEYRYRLDYLGHTATGLTSQFHWCGHGFSPWSKVSLTDRKNTTPPEGCVGQKFPYHHAIWKPSRKSHSLPQCLLSLPVCSHLNLSPQQCEFLSGTRGTHARLFLGAQKQW